MDVAKNSTEAFSNAKSTNKTVLYQGHFTVLASNKSLHMSYALNGLLGGWGEMRFEISPTSNSSEHRSRRGVLIVS